MNLFKLREFAHVEMVKWGLIEQGWVFKWGKRKTSLGTCHYRERTITISREFAELNSEAQMVDTVLHEIAHAIVGIGYDHGPVWKQACLLVGCRPVAVVTSNQVVTPTHKWLIVCEKCGKTLARRHTRRMKLETKICAYCDSGVKWELSEKVENRG